MVFKILIYLEEGNIIFTLIVFLCSKGARLFVQMGGGAHLLGASSVSVYYLSWEKTNTKNKVSSRCKLNLLSDDDSIPPPRAKGRSNV